MFKIATYIDNILRALTTLAYDVDLKNGLSLTDDNEFSENFFRDLLNKIYGYNLVNLNEKKFNYAGIDLGDKKKKVCIQVTSDNSSSKIQKAINVSEEYERYKEYDRIIIMIVGFKKKYTKIFESEHFKFDSTVDIWDIRDIVKEIKNKNDMNIARDISEFLESQLEIGHINPIELTDFDISSIIRVIYDEFRDDGKGDSDKRFKLHERSDDFIKKKNSLNGVDDMLFNNEIRLSLQYDKSIEDFLGNPINLNYQRKYFSICDMLQKIYTENPEDFDGIGSLFSHVFDKIVNYKNHKIIDSQKLLIILHNMYFNCDIGKNPDQYVGTK